MLYKKLSHLRKEKYPRDEKIIAKETQWEYNLEYFIRDFTFIPVAEDLVLINRGHDFVVP